MAPNELARLAENETIFRNINEDIQEWEKGDNGSTRSYDKTKISFYCECSDPKCKEKIEMTPAKYGEIHEHRKQFILKPGHNIKKIEKVVQENDDHIIVKKYVTPPEEQEETFTLV